MRNILFLHVPRKEKISFTLTFFLSGFISMLMRFLPYQYVAKHFGGSCHIFIGSTLISNAHIKKALLIQKTIDRTTRYTPWTLTCLTQALIAKGWCRYYQIPYLLFIGIDKTPTHLSQREAHAWVTAGPISITGGGHQCFQTHHVISSFSNAR